MEEISICNACGETDTIRQTDDAGICMECGTPEDYKYVSAKMLEFVDKVDQLCYEYGYEIWPTKEGYTGKVNEHGKLDTIAIIGKDEIHEITGIDGDGNGP